MFSRQASLLVLAAFVALATAQETTDIVQLCNGKLARIDSISQAKALIEEIKSTTEQSCQQYKNTLELLEPVLRVVDSGNICNLEFVDGIFGQYHRQFIRTKSFLVPEPIRRFVIRLGFEITAKCTSTLANVLVADTENKIAETDYEILEMQTVTFSSPDLDDGSLDLEDVALSENIRRQSNGRTQEILVGENVGAKLGNIMRVCTSMFQPFYEQLIVPLLKMSSMGYNLPHGQVERKLNNPNLENSLRRWYNLVRVCESLASVDIFVDKENLLDEKSKHTLTFIPTEVAKELRQKNGTLMNSVLRTVHPVKYATPTITTVIEDKLPEMDEEELELLVASRKYEDGFSSMVKQKAKAMKMLSSGKIPPNALSVMKCSRTLSFLKKRKCNVEVINLDQKTIKELEESDKRPGKRVGKNPTWLKWAMGITLGIAVLLMVCFPLLIFLG